MTPTRESESVFPTVGNGPNYFVDGADRLQICDGDGYDVCRAKNHVLCLELLALLNWNTAQIAALRKLVEVARHVMNQLSFYKPTDREQAEYAESLRAAIKECEQP